MSDALSWSINLGRWSGTQVRVHALLILFAALHLLHATTSPTVDVLPTLGWLALLGLVLILHELGHAAMALRLGAEVEDVQLWPLGNLIGPASAGVRTPEASWVALGGLATSGVLALLTIVALHVAGEPFVLSPLGAIEARPFTVGWTFAWFAYLNWILFLANLIPALPFDGGRVVRSVMAGRFGVPKESLAPLWTARTAAAVVLIAGAIWLFWDAAFGLALVGIAGVIELIVRAEARQIEDGGLFEEGVFGYDFSQGYTSLERSAPKVRPYRESALKRWRRRRAELRRRRREAREAAEERRMDEILEKLFREGRAALSDEENRFLVRVSAKYRSRPKARD